MRKHADSTIDVETSSTVKTVPRHFRDPFILLTVLIACCILAGIGLRRHLGLHRIGTKPNHSKAAQNSDFIVHGSSIFENASRENVKTAMSHGTNRTHSVPVSAMAITDRPHSGPSTQQHRNTSKTQSALTTTSPSTNAPSRSRSTNTTIVDRSPARLALCIAGNARTFHYQMVHSRILENVVHPLRDVATVDVFFLIKLNDNPRPLHPTSPRRSWSTRAAIAKFHPVFIRQLGPDDDILHEIHPSRYHPVYKTKLDANNNTVHVLTERLLSKPKTPNCTADRGSRAYVPHSLHRTRQCLSEIRSYEAKHRKVRYKYLYRIRPDVVFLDVIPMPTLLAPGVVITNAVPSVNIHTLTKWWQKTKKMTPPDTGDHFLAALTQDADVAFSAVNGMHDCEFFKLPVLRNPEAMTLFWLLSNKLTPITPMATWVLVRERTGPECKRVHMLRVTNPVEKQSMVRKCEQFRKDFVW